MMFDTFGTSGSMFAHQPDLDEPYEAEFGVISRYPSAVVGSFAEFCRRFPDAQAPAVARAKLLCVGNVALRVVAMRPL